MKKLSSLSLLLVPALLCATSCGGEAGSAEVTPKATSAPSPSSKKEAPGARGKGPSVAAEKSAEDLYREAREALSQGKVEAGIALLRRALELDPNHVDAHFQLGTALVPMSSAAELGSSTRDLAVLDEALGHLEQALAARPEDAELFYWTGRTLDLRGRDAQARAMLEKCVALDPEHGPAHKRLGLVLVEGGEMELARAAFRRASELEPGDAGIRFQLGNLLMEEDPAAARTEYEAAVEIDPTFPWAYHGLSQVLAQLGDPQGAEAARAKLEIYQGHEKRLRALVQRAGEKSDDPEAQFDAAELYFALGREEEALTMFRRTLDLQPDNALAHYCCGLIAQGRGQSEMAMNHFEESIYLDPTQFGPKIELLRVSAELGNASRIDDLTLDLVQVVADAEPDVRNACAEALLEVGKKDEALLVLRGVLEAEPENEVARILLERANP